MTGTGVHAADSTGASAPATSVIPGLCTENGQGDNSSQLAAFAGVAVPADELDDELAATAFAGAPALAATFGEPDASEWEESALWSAVRLALPEPDRESVR